MFSQLQWRDINNLGISSGFLLLDPTDTSHAVERMSADARKEAELLRKRLMNIYLGVNLQVCVSFMLRLLSANDLTVARSWSTIHHQCGAQDGPPRCAGCGVKSGNRDHSRNENRIGRWRHC